MVAPERRKHKRRSRTAAPASELLQLSGLLGGAGGNGRTGGPAVIPWSPEVKQGQIRGPSRRPCLVNQMIADMGWSYFINILSRRASLSTHVKTHLWLVSYGTSVTVPRPCAPRVLGGSFWGIPCSRRAHAGPSIWPLWGLGVHRGTARQLCGPVSCRYLYLRTELERTRFGEALDRFDLCVVLRDALGCQMWIVEARSHDDSDTLDCAGFRVVDAVRLRTTVACQPDDRWRNSLNRRAGFSICFRHAGSRGRVHPRVPDWRNGVHENAMLGTFNRKNAHQSDHCALGRRIGGLAT